MCLGAYTYTHAKQMYICAHTGKEVALYCAKTIPHLLLRSESYGQGDYVSALKNAFMSCDHQLLSKEAVQEMKEMLYQNNDLG